MPANTIPIFIGTPQIQWAMLSSSNVTASRNFDGTGVLGTDIQTIFSASSSGSRVDSISVHPMGTNVQTTVTFFINNAMDNTASMNNTGFYGLTMPLTVISNNTALLRTEVTFPNGINLPANYRLLASLGTSVATGFHISVYGGDY